MRRNKISKLFTALILALGIAATGCCSESGKSSSSEGSKTDVSLKDDSESGKHSTAHTHTFSNSYEYDDVYHWYPSTCGHDVQSGKTKHSFSSRVTDPTYQSSGYTTHTCTVCGYSYTDNVTGPLSHRYSTEWSKDSSSHWHACLDEGYERLKKDESPHDFASAVTDPTYQSGGYTTHTCTVCGYSYKDSETNPLTITITWQNYDGIVLEVDNNVPYGSMPNYDGFTPSKPSDDKFYYSFSGWSPEVEKAVESKIYTALFSNSQLYYSIDFDLNGGTSSSYAGPIEAKALDSDYFFFDCHKDDWVFKGWEYQGERIFDESGNLLKNIQLADGMVFKAIYSQTVKLTITNNNPEAGFVAGDGEYPLNSYVDVSAKANQGYAFAGWYYQDTLLSNTEDYRYVMWDRDITLEARFRLDSFAMRVFSNDADQGLVMLRSTINNNYLAEYEEPRKYLSEVTIVAYSKTDVRFLGWYNENNELVSTNTVYTFVMPNHDYTLEAKWDRFEINYILNGGTNSEDNPAYFAIDDDEIILSKPIRSELEFMGWRYNDAFIDKIDSTIIHAGEAITLEAVWREFDYSIYEADDATKYIEITGPDGLGDELFIPETLKVDGENVPVKSIGQEAFDDCSSLKSVCIPDSVTSIGDYAFSGCSGLESASIGENSRMQSIGNDAFRDCSSLKSITIPGSVTSIGDEAFYSCSSLKSITIPDSVASIGDEAFYSCSSLESIFIPGSVTSIGAYAFSGCSSLAIYCEAASKPSGWNSTWSFSDLPVAWGSYHGAHGNAGGFKYAICADEAGDLYIRIVGLYAYSGDVLIPESIEVSGEDILVKAINNNAFRNCSSLKSVCIPDSVTSIGDYAFFGCSGLESASIGENSRLESIGAYAFYGCSGLESIFIPDSVTSIGAYAFYGCSGLESVSIGESSFLETIGNYAFENCHSLKSITIPDSVASIGDYAFRNCYSLESIFIPGSVTSIGGYAFYGCSSVAIYCEAASKPSGWSSYWNYYSNYSSRPVTWNSKR